MNGNGVDKVRSAAGAAAGRPDRVGGFEPGAGDVLPGVDPSKPSVARIYDYFLNGEHYFEVDRIAAERLRRHSPEVHEATNCNRIFVRRTVRWIARAGIDQFLDIGSGLPTQENTHQVAAEINPEARVVYVDHDPTVAAHAAMLLGGSGTAAFVAGDLTDPAGILDHPDTLAVLDLDRPVGVVLAAIVHFVPDRSDPYGLLRRYLDQMAPGSFLAVSHITKDGQDPVRVQAIKDLTRDTPEALTFRTRSEVRRLFDGLDLVPPYHGAEPDLVWCNVWGAADPESADRSGSWLWAGVGRKR